MTSSGMYCCSFWCQVIFWNRSPLSEYSITMLKKSDELNKNINETYHKLLLGSSIKASLYEEMFGCRTLTRILTSFKAFSFSLSESLTILTFLRAYISWSASLFTWYTDEYAPSPKQYFTIRSRMVAASH